MTLTTEVLFEAIYSTILMTVISTVLGYLIGTPIGILLYTTSKKGLKPNKVINSIVGSIVNVFRSIPCLLIITILIPVHNFIKLPWSGGWYSMILPLVVASFGFIARMIEQSMAEVNLGVIEAAKSLGASNWQIITRVLLTEARPSLMSGLAVTVVSIIGYTSFAEAISGNGLIQLAYNLGFTGSDKAGMWLCILIVIVIVQLIQEGGLLISKKIDKRRK